MKKDAEKIKKEYSEICKEYVSLFAKKHSLENIDDSSDFWVGDNVGGIATLGDLFVNFDDIRYDIDNDVPKEKFLKWYSRDQELYSLSLKYMNYSTFCKGAPEPYTNEDIEKIQEAKERAEVAKKDLLEAINNLNKSPYPFKTVF